MFRHATNPLIIILVILNFCWIINAQHLPLCESLNDLQGNETEKNNSEGKSRRIRALCEAIYSSRAVSDRDELDSIPDFDLTQIDSGRDLLGKCNDGKKIFLKILFQTMTPIKY